ncbi:MAG: hypothetical protein HY658_05020 [Actinobacteria bacterium]|nr:hypothetical protein [Actinomycetota bacterium]
MVTTKQTENKARGALYAGLGAGQLALEKARGAADWMRDYATPSGFRAYWSKRADRAAKTYSSLAVRGRKLARSMAKSAPAKRAGEQTKVARTQIKAAATSVRKALGANVEVGKSAAKKVS